MLQHYKDNFVRTTDLFLVRNSLLQYYVNKLNKYDEICYISENDIQIEKSTDQREEIVNKNVDETVDKIIKNDIVSNVQLKEPSSPVIIKISKKRRKKQTTKPLEATI